MLLCLIWPISVISVFSPNAGKYGPEKTPYLGTFHAVIDVIFKGNKGQQVGITSSLETKNLHLGADLLEILHCSQELVNVLVLCVVKTM